MNGKTVTWLPEIYKDVRIIHVNLDNWRFPIFTRKRNDRIEKICDCVNLRYYDGAERQDIWISTFNLDSLNKKGTWSEIINDLIRESIDDVISAYEEDGKNSVGIRPAIAYVFQHDDDPNIVAVSVHPLHCSEIGYVVTEPFVI